MSDALTEEAERVMRGYPDDERGLMWRIRDAIGAAELRGRVAGLREAASICITQYDADYAPGDWPTPSQCAGACIDAADRLESKK